MNLKDMSIDKIVEYICEMNAKTIMVFKDSFPYTNYEREDFKTELLRRFAELEQKAEEGQRAIEAMERLSDPNLNIHRGYDRVIVAQVLQDYQAKEGKQKEND